MTKEEKEILLKYLCMAQPYGVKFKDEYEEDSQKLHYVLNEDVYSIKYPRLPYWVETIKPYLRPMSSMTEEEKSELLSLIFDKEAKYFYIDEEGLIDGKISELMKEGFNYPAFCPINIELYTDFMLSHHFDFMGLIEKDLALDCTELHIYD